MSTSSARGRDVRIVLFVALGVVFLWATLQVDYIIFAGVLLAIFLNGLAGLASEHLRLRHGWALALVILLIVVLVVGIGYGFAEAIASQIGQLVTQFSAAAHRLQVNMAHLPWARPLIADLKPARIMNAGALGGLFGVASNAVGLVGGILLTCFFGLYMAAEPGIYTHGLLTLLPIRHRQRTREILAAVADVLWSWMLGRLFSMIVVGVGTTAGLWALGMPLPAALGTLAGILTFVPYLGAIMSAVPSLIIALSVDPRQALYVAILYLAVHVLEGYVLVPLVQRRAARLPPAMILAGQLILGALSGIVGVTFATPLVAALVPAVRMAYVEDMLTDRAKRAQTGDYGERTRPLESH